MLSLGRFQSGLHLRILPVEIGEEVAVMTDFMTQNELCQQKDEPENKGWKCRIGKPGSPGDLSAPTAKQLHTNMVNDGAMVPSDPPKRSGSWDLDKCTPLSHPFQSHHLIPKMHLPEHDVCVWLAKKAKNSQWELTESTHYDTDDAKNGEALPFASSTYQWKQTSNPAEQERICNTMMDKTGKQLHQGSHTYEDYGEEDSLHANEQPGYLGAVDELLKVINGQTLSHVRLCPDCKKNDTTPRKVRPLQRVVLAMHQASGLMRIIIRKNKRFVSERAAKHLGSANT